MFEGTHRHAPVPLHDGIRYKHKFMVSKLISFSIFMYLTKKYTIVTIKYPGYFICSADVLLFQQQKRSESKSVYKKENEMVEIMT